MEIVADTIGHDLSRGTANYIRPEPPRPVANNQDVADESGPSVGGGADGDEYLDEDAVNGNVAALPSGDPEADERFDEEAAVEEFRGELEEPIETPQPV